MLPAHEINKPNQSRKMVVIRYLFNDSPHLDGSEKAPSRRAGGAAQLFFILFYLTLIAVSISWCATFHDCRPNLLKLYQLGRAGEQSATCISTMYIGCMHASILLRLPVMRRTSRALVTCSFLITEY